MKNSLDAQTARTGGRIQNGAALLTAASEWHKKASKRPQNPGMGPLSPQKPLPLYDKNRQAVSKEAGFFTTDGKAAENPRIFGKNSEWENVDRLAIIIRWNMPQGMRPLRGLFCSHS